MRHQELKNREAFEVVGAVQLEAKAEASKPAQPAPAAPDMPKAAGALLIATYVLLMSGFLVTIRGAHAEFAILIGLFYLAMFFGIPAAMLGIEHGGEQGGARRPDLAEFLERGIDTANGRISGAGALVQMLIVPGLLTLAVLAMGITYLVS